MAAKDTATRRKAAQVAALERHGSDPQRITEARRDLKAARLAAYVAKCVSEAPKLSAEQLNRIAVLLHGGGAA